MLSSSVRARQGLSSTPRTSISQRRSVRARIFRREGPIVVEDNIGTGLESFQEPPTKRQRENVKKTLMDLGFTEQASDILAYGKITNSNADLLIGDIRASFGLYQPPPPSGPVEQVQSSVQDLLDRLKLPFLGLVLAAGAYAAYSARESLGGVLPDAEQLAESVYYAADTVFEALEKLPFLDDATVTKLQDGVDEFLYNALQR